MNLLRVKAEISMENNRVKVSIDGVSYSLISDEEESRVVQAAHMITNLLQSVHKASAVEREKAAVLVALQLAMRVLKQEEYEQNQIEKTKRLLEKLELDTTFAQLP